MKSLLMRTFANRYPLAGSVLWILSIQYFAVQIVVAGAWAAHYSWRLNTISDLGNTACGTYGGRYVCSPSHALMNVSLIVLGITMFLGSLLMYRQYKDGRGSLIGFSCMAVSGLGSLMVGLFPENGIATLHITGATLSFFVGNIGLVVLSMSLSIPRSLKIYTFLSGALALVALGLFLNHNYLGLGEGGMERVVAYPQTVWLIVFGIYAYSSQRRKRYNKAIKQGVYMSDIRLDVYLFFKGECREAMEFYKSIFGGDLTVQTYADVPDMPNEASKKDWLMHARLEGGDIKLLGSDTDKASSEAAKIDLTLGGTDEAKMRKLFDKLSDGGKVNMPLKKEFWGDIFGSLTDKYGINWMMNIGDSQG